MIRDRRLAKMARAVPFATELGLGELGAAERPEHGPVTAREERVREVRARRQSGA